MKPEPLPNRRGFRYDSNVVYFDGEDIVVKVDGRVYRRISVDDSDHNHTLQMYNLVLDPSVCV